MIAPGYCKLMARYNAWQNGSIFMAADGLADTAREADRGAFWGSIRRTLSHLMWGDLIWLSRFDGGDSADGPGSNSPEAYDWPALMAARPALDARFIAWADGLGPNDLDGDLTWYSGLLKRDMSLPKAACAMQMFNHQTHHRGQVHAMLTAAGAKPDDTDIQLLPEVLPPWP